MPASMEILSGVIRIHKEGGLGQPYHWFCAFTAEENVIYLHGALTAPKPSEWKQLEELFRSKGYTEVRWARHRSDGSVRWRYWYLG